MNNITFTDIDMAIQEAIWLAREEKRTHVVVRRGHTMTVHRKADVSKKTKILFTAYVAKRN